MSGDDIRAYILLVCLVPAYPVLLGVRAIEKAIGPEVVVYDGCRYEAINEYSRDLKNLRPLDDEAKTCIEKRKKDNEENAAFNYQQAHRKHKRGDEVNQ